MTRLKFFDGLHPHERLLAVLGAILFVVLVIVLLRLVFRGQPFGGLLGFFAVPIVMIGFPAIKSIEFAKDVVKIETFTEQLQNNPTDPTLRNNLRNAVSEIATRPSSNPKTLTIISGAHFALGDESTATANLQKALRVNPGSQEAHDLQIRIETKRNLDRLATRVEANPNEPSTTAELSRTLSEATKLRFANPQALASIARAQAATGHHQQALESAEKALAADPNSKAAIEVKRRAMSAVARVTPTQ